MSENESVLTQEAIDALLTGRQGEAAQSGKPRPAAAAGGSAPARPDGAAPAAPAGGGSPAAKGAGNGMATATAKKAAGGTDSKQLAAALKRIERLEKLVEALKAHITEAAALKAVAARVVKLERGAAADPIFNIYGKFTCSSCGTKGAAPIR
jgi:hypothetical protein